MESIGIIEVTVGHTDKCHAAFGLEEILPYTEETKQRIVEEICEAVEAITWNYPQVEIGGIIFKIKRGL